ncbi:unnamed protein product [Cladocopium goreaui]|uniref:BTB domain-containing protein n=1 Tax=Cladocopium goreaui TaxID=2562237 RepID=A0A9P1C5J4_9DINO|nr:unnamed protein product [Cladocopium goreaui]
MVEDEKKLIDPKFPFREDLLKAVDEDDDDDDEEQEKGGESEVSTPSEPAPVVNPETAAPDVMPATCSSPAPSLAPTMSDDEGSVAGCEPPPCDPCVGQPVVEQPPAGPNPLDEKPSQLVMISDEEGEGTCPVKAHDPDWPEWFDPLVEDSQPDPDWRYTAPKPEEPQPSASTYSCLSAELKQKLRLKVAKIPTDVQQTIPLSEEVSEALAAQWVQEQQQPEVVAASPAKPLPSPEPEVLGESKEQGGPTDMKVDEPDQLVADDETEKLLKAKTLVLGETDDTIEDAGGPPLTREQQRAFRKSQARGAGKDSPSRKSPAKKSQRAKPAATPETKPKRKRGAANDTANDTETTEPKCAKRGTKPAALAVNPVPMEVKWLTEPGRSFEDRLDPELARGLHAAIQQEVETEPPGSQRGRCGQMGWAAESLGVWRFVEMFAGEANVSKACLERSLPGVSCDYIYGGLAILAVLRLEPQSLGLLAQRSDAVPLALPSLDSRGQKRSTGVKKRLKTSQTFGCDVVDVQFQPEFAQPCGLFVEGYSSGSAGGSILDTTEAATPAEPPQGHGAFPDPALPKQVPGEGEVPPTVAGPMPGFNTTMETLEKEMMERLQLKMLELEESFTREIHEKKRVAEQELEKEYNGKRAKLDEEIFDLQENLVHQQTQLALASEQLQERMLLVSDEQKCLDDLREKTRQMKLQLEAAADHDPPMHPPPCTPSSKAKELLKKKLEQTQKKPAVPISTPSPASLPSAVRPSENTGDLGEVSVNGPMVPVSDQRFTSSTHPQAWHCLYRMCRKPDGIDKEIYDKWHSGGAKRDQLLKDFVCRCFAPADDFNKNKAKLQALITLRQKTSQWRRNLQGYSWHTEEEMKTVLKWSQSKVDGAVKYCTKRKMTKKCIYDVTALKFLVQTRDDVEAGDEKIKELESEMREIGLFDSEFSLGDVLDEGEDEQSASPNNGPKKKKLEEYPDVEGDESLPEYIGQYKRACLSRKALLKTTKERLEKDNVSPADYKLLGCSGFQLLFKASFHVLPQLVEILNLWCFRSKV